jgi:hypothetical protein
VLELCSLNETLLFGDTWDEAIRFARHVSESVAAG